MQRRCVRRIPLSVCRRFFVCFVSVKFCLFTPPHALADPASINIVGTDIPQSIVGGTNENWVHGDRSITTGAAKPNWRIHIDQPALPEPPEGFCINQVNISGANETEASRINRRLGSRPTCNVTKQNLKTIISDLNAVEDQYGGATHAVFIPPQTFEDGIFEIAVLSGRLRNIKINGVSHTHQAILKELGRTHLQPVTNAALEAFSAAAVDVVGTSLELVVSPDPSFNGDIDVEMNFNPLAMEFEVGIDNYAPLFVDRKRINGEIVAKNLLQTNDELSFYGSTSLDFEQFHFFQFAYESTPLENGPVVTFSASQFRLRPRVDFLKALGFELLSKSYKIDLSFPIKNNPTFNANLDVGLLRRDVTRLINSKKANNSIWSTYIGGDIEKIHNNGGSTNFTVKFQRAIDIFDTTPVFSQSTLRALLGPGDHFLNMKLEHERPLFPGAVLEISLFRQTATGPIIGPDQCEYGGGPMGLGYDPIELSGDACILGKMELKANPKSIRVLGSDTEFFVSFDHGTVSLAGSINPAAPIKQTPKTSLQSIGAGIEVDWTPKTKLSLKIGIPMKESALPGVNKPVRFALSLKSSF